MPPYGDSGEPRASLLRILGMTLMGCDGDIGVREGPCAILEKNVSEVMSTPAVVAHFENRLDYAIKEMYKANVGSVIVVNDSGRVVGVLTRKDLVYLAASGVLAKNPRLREVMSSSIVTASLDDTILDVLKRMIDTGVRHIPIVEENRIVGVVSLTDIARYLGESLVSICVSQGNL